MDEMDKIVMGLNNQDVWEKQEKEFLETIKCYLVKKDSRKYRAICTSEYILEAVKKYGIFYMWFLDNPMNFIKDQNNILVPYGFWTCKCQSSFVKTPYSTFCKECNCNIRDNTKRVKYFEDMQRV